MTTATTAPADIQALLYRYALGADQRDPCPLASCFVAETKIIGPGYELAGPVAEIIASELQRRFVWTQHNVFNPLYAVNGDTATGATNCIASHVEKQADGSHLKHDWYIRYHDQLVRRDDQWRFLERRMDVGFTSTIAVNPLG